MRRRSLFLMAWMRQEGALSGKTLRKVLGAQLHACLLLVLVLFSCIRQLCCTVHVSAMQRSGILLTPRL